MKIDEFKNITQSILSNLSDQAKVSELLMTLNDDYGKQIATQDQLSTKVTEQEGNIKSLQETNMNLFLKVANPVPEPVIQNPVDKPISYEDLIQNWEG